MVKKNIFLEVLFYLLIIAIAIYLIFPFYWALISALKTENELVQTPASFIPNHPTLINFKAVLSNPDFLRGMVNSLIIAVTTTLFSLVFGSFAGYALGKLRFRGRKPALYLILAMTMFPQVAILSGLFTLIRFVKDIPNSVGFLSWLYIPTPALLIAMYMIFTLPFTVWVLTSFFKGLPQSLLQAAQVDGATFFQTFWHVLLPLTAPALVTTGILAFINAWNEYLFALTFTLQEPSSRTVPVAISQLSGKIARQEPVGEIMAGALIITVPLIILVLVFQNRIVEGLTAGSVKG
ncbi:MAG TPA: carbohydrate ABC transporter permease [Trueperaceae bacterium]|nr:carbohydrate ABC transporter permease [Trueperaceae bacterium]